MRSTREALLALHRDLRSRCLAPSIPKDVFAYRPIASQRPRLSPGIPPSFGTLHLQPELDQAADGFPHGLFFVLCELSANSIRRLSASGRPGLSGSLDRQPSSVASASRPRRTPISVPFPVVTGRPIFFRDFFTDFVLAQRRAEGKVRFHPGSYHSDLFFSVQ